LENNNVVEEPLRILNYLPIRFKNSVEQEYIEFLWDSFESNYNNEKYQFSFIAYHMLFMSFVYFNVWQIKKIQTEDFDKITLGFHDCFETATSPFTFSQESESKILTIFRFLGLGVLHEYYITELNREPNYGKIERIFEELITEYATEENANI